MKFAEFFAGGRCFGRVAEELGHTVTSTDIEPYEGIDIVMDAEFLTLEILKELGIELGFKQIMTIEPEKGMKKINNSFLEI